MKRIIVVSAVSVICLLIFFQFPAFAHVLSLGSIEGRVDGKNVRFSMIILKGFQADSEKQFQSDLRDQMRFWNNGAPCRLDLISVGKTTPTFINFNIACQDQIGILSLHSKFMVDKKYRFNISMISHGEIQAVVLGDGKQEVCFNLNPGVNKSSLRSYFRQFVSIGMWHIYSGYDHILFVLALILVCPQLWPLLKTVTAFTLAHSLTLILASFNVLRVPETIIGPMIAFSIAFVAVEGIISYFLKSSSIWFKILSYRWCVAFVFGLFHGLAFSSGLRDINIPPQLLIPSLLSFNVGVELAQMTIVAVTVPILFYFRKHSWFSRIILALLCLIGLLGAVWFVQRVGVR